MKLNVTCSFTGFAVSIDQIPAWIRWVNWIDLFKFGYTSLAILEFSDIKYSCTPAELARYYGLCPVTNGNQKLDQIGFDAHHFLRDIYLLIVVFVVGRFLAWALLAKGNGW